MPKVSKMLRTNIFFAFSVLLYSLSLNKGPQVSCGWQQIAITWMLLKPCWSPSVLKMHQTWKWRLPQGEHPYWKFASARNTTGSSKQFLRIPSLFQKEENFSLTGIYEFILTFYVTKIKMTVKVNTALLPFMPIKK